MKKNPIVSLKTRKVACFTVCLALFITLFSCSKQGVGTSAVEPTPYPRFSSLQSTLMKEENITFDNVDPKLSPQKAAEAIVSGMSDEEIVGQLFMLG